MIDGPADKEPHDEGFSYLFVLSTSSLNVLPRPIPLLDTASPPDLCLTAPHGRGVLRSYLGSVSSSMTTTGNAIHIWEISRVFQKRSFSSNPDEATLASQRDLYRTTPSEPEPGILMPKDLLKGEPDG